MNVAGHDPGCIKSDLAFVPTGKMEHKVYTYALSLPFIELLTRIIAIRKATKLYRDKPYSRLFDGADPALYRLRKGAARWPALHEIYNWKNEDSNPYGRFWFNIRNAQAVRNRYKIVTSQIRIQALRMIDLYGEARILSIASGSAQCVFEAVSGLPDVRVVCLDQDQSALEHSRNLATKYGITNVSWHLGNVLKPGNTLEDIAFQPNIVEMVGLIDYFSDRAIVTIFKRIKKLMQLGGVFITGHIHPNAESNFLSTACDWDMRYRSIPELRALVCEGGFPNHSIITEPHLIHSVVTATN